MSRCFLPPVLCSHDLPSWNPISFSFPPIQILIINYSRTGSVLPWSLLNNFGSCFFLPHYTTVYINQCVCGLLEIAKTLSGGTCGHKNFHNNIKILSVFLIVLTPALIAQKQLCQCLSTIQEWYQALWVITVFFTATYSKKRKSHCM